MVKMLTEEKNYEDIADAIRTKLKVENTYLPSEMDDAILSIPTEVTNGIIKQYLSTSENISTASFVEFVGDFANGNFANCVKQLTSTTTGSIETSAVKLSESRVFVVCRLGDDAYGQVCTVSNGEVLAGTSVVLPNSSHLSSYYDEPRAVLVGKNVNNEETVLIHHNAYTSGNVGAFYVTICKISGTTVTPISDTATNIGQVGSHQSMVAIDNNTVFLVYSYATDGIYSIYARVCTVSDNGISSSGAETMIASNVGTVFSPHPLVAVSPTTVVVAHALVSAGGLNATACAVSGTTITPGSSVQIASGTSTTDIDDVDVAALSPSKLMFSYGLSRALHGQVCTISGTTITPGTDTALSSTSVVGNNYGYYSSKVVAVNPTTAVVTHRHGDYLGGVSCTISGTTITPGTDVRYTDAYGYDDQIPFLMSNKYIFDVLPYSRGSDPKYGYGVVIGADMKVQLPQSGVDGVTASPVTPSAAGDVWVFNHQHVV